MAMHERTIARVILGIFAVAIIVAAVATQPLIVLLEWAVAIVLFILFTWAVIHA